MAAILRAGKNEELMAVRRDARGSGHDLHRARRRRSAPTRCIHPGVHLEGQTPHRLRLRDPLRRADHRLDDRRRRRDQQLLRHPAVARRAAARASARSRISGRQSQRRRGRARRQLRRAEEHALGRGSKANHLAYLGDATIGEKVNVGAGTITCNYDGVAKHPTVIEDGAFIGSDSQLVAPVRVGNGAYVAAGSSITEDVPPDVARDRARQAGEQGRLGLRSARRR